MRVCERASHLLITFFSVFWSLLTAPGFLYSFFSHLRDCTVMASKWPMGSRVCQAWDFLLIISILCVCVCVCVFNFSFLNRTLSWNKWKWEALGERKCKFFFCLRSFFLFFSFSPHRQSSENIWQPEKKCVLAVDCSRDCCLWYL